MKILLISGHGAGDPGATAKIDNKLYKEADQTIIMVKKIQEHLSKHAEVTLYPTTRNAYADCQSGVLKTKAKFANYDYVLEVHFNACVKDLKGNGVTTGTECYITTSETGDSVEKAILANIAKLGFKNRGVKKKNWAVINESKKAGTSAALLEVCFIDDADDMRLYLQKQNDVAKSIANGIISGFGLKKKASTTPDYAAEVCKKAKLSKSTREYLDGYKYSSDLWKKLWTAMK